MKGFKRATIEAMDDGSFSVTVCLPEKEKEDVEEKEGKGMVAVGYGDEKRMTAATLEEAIKKITSAGGDSEEDDSSDKSEKRMDDLMRRMQNSFGKNMKEGSK